MSDQIVIDFNKPLPDPVHGEQLQPEERRILELIRPGRAAARQVAEIAGLCGVKDIEVRQIVRHLRIHHNVLIASATSKPAGYYIATNEAESRAGIRQIVNRIRALRELLDEMDRQTAEKIFGQRNYLDELKAEEKKAS